uniref:transcription factor 21-like n=1 Tax=Ciona intestinalis TaxID=7719 RepID=UPI0005212D0D|nr:transcription factor 21-like [Ciona intestinalis]|eukprot:XP_026690926.1 transcription factor 21-like [Ciona intestinalis]
MNTNLEEKFFDDILPEDFVQLCSNIDYDVFDLSDCDVEYDDVLLRCEESIVDGRSCTNCDVKDRTKLETRDETEKIIEPSNRKRARRDIGKMSTKRRRLEASEPGRNAANFRERSRMRVLSRAFETLKQSLPWVPSDTRLSKLDTLKLACFYINHLSITVQRNCHSLSESSGCRASYIY